MKRKLLSVFLALCMTLTLVPAASAHWVANSDGSQPADAKFKVEYYNLETKEIVETRYFNNVDNDDWGGEDGTLRDHFWDPITVMGDDEKLSGCTIATITLFDDITLTDTTILVAKGHNVVIDGDGHKITCTLTGTLGDDPGSAHVAGQDAISIASDNESNRLILRNVTVEINGPQAEGAAGQTGAKDTQGIYNDGELQLYENANIMINGVSQNGINGSGSTIVYGNAKLDVKNVGGSGIKGDYVSVTGGAAVTVSGTEAHGVTIGGLFVQQASVTTTNTGLYGIIAEYITLDAEGTLKATCAEGAKVPAPIRVLEGGAFSVASDATVTGTAWADNVTGDGRGNVTALSSAASIENTKYATLQNAVEGASENDTIQLLRDVTLTEKLTIDKAITLDGNGKTITGQKNSTDVYFEITGGDVTIQDLTAKDFGGNISTKDQWGLFKVPEEDSTSVGTLILSDVTASNFNCAAVDVREGSLSIWNCAFDCANESKSKSTKGVVAENINGNISMTTITNAGTTSTEGDNACAVETWGNILLTIRECTFGKDGAEVKNGVSMNIDNANSSVFMNETTIAATDHIAILNSTTGSDSTNTSHLTIGSGYYKGTFQVNQETAQGDFPPIWISAGYFTADPSAYVTAPMAAVESDLPGYNFMIGEAPQNTIPADVVSGESEIAKVPDSITDEEDKKLADSVQNALSNGDGPAPTLLEDEGPINVAARAVANQNKITAEDGKGALQKENVTIGENATVSIVIQPYMDISITKADSANNTFTLDITPMYRTIATTANLSNNEEIHLSGESQNAAEVVPSAKLAVTKPVTISIPLPTSFTTQGNLWVKHIKDSGKVYYYQGTVSTETQGNKQVLTFVNPKGFSSFEIMSGFTPVASIGDVNYASLQDAIHDVADGGTIELLTNGQTATVSQEISFKVDLNNFTADITAGSGYTMSVDENTNIYTFTKKASTGGGGGGGGGGSSTPTYTVTTGSTSNGTVTVSPKNPTKGSTVTVNVTPLDGYQLDTLTITDANGKKVEVKKKTDTEYTFTMPASKVTVSAVFVEIPEEPTPSVPQFTDVSEGAWYYEAVRYVCEKGMMDGVAEGVFAPDATTSRAMLVTILYRLEKEPAASGSSFTDVPSGQWYTNAVAWAAANGIVNGITDTTFAPNRPITREQMAAILYRYAAWKGCDISGQVDLSGYTDAAAVSGYAKEALAWANAEGLITGVTDTTLRPAGSAVRAQAATILMRLCENVLA